MRGSAPLAVGRSGFRRATVFFPDFVGKWQESFWRGAIFTAASNHVLEGVRAPGLKWVGVLPLVAASALASSAPPICISGARASARVSAKPGVGLLYVFFYNKWFFDELYDVVFVKGAKALGDFLWKERRPEDHRWPGSQRRFLAVAAHGRARGSGCIQSGLSLSPTPSSCCSGVAGLLSYCALSLYG